MSKYEAKPLVIEATQWFKNGDHPKDNSKELIGTDGQFLSGGKVVRRYRYPSVDGQAKCDKCGDIMHNHGWIDKLEDGEVVCPGDFVVLGWNGLYYALKPDEFNKRYKMINEELISMNCKNIDVECCICSRKDTLCVPDIDASQGESDGWRMDEDASGNKIYNCPDHIGIRRDFFNNRRV